MTNAPHGRFVRSIPFVHLDGVQTAQTRGRPLFHGGGLIAASGITSDAVGLIGPAFSRNTRMSPRGRQEPMAECQ